MQKIFAALFDFSFKKFVTPQLATVIFVVAIMLSAITSVALLHMTLGFIIAPVFFLASLLFSRTAIELVLAVFQIARYTAEIARRGRSHETDNTAPMGDN